MAFDNRRINIIVGHFHRSSKATYSLKQNQNQPGLHQPALKAHMLLGGEMFGQFTGQQ